MICNLQTTTTTTTTLSQRSVRVCWFAVSLLLLFFEVSHAENETFPADQIFVIDVQEFSFEDAISDLGIPQAIAETIVLNEFKRYFGNDVEFFDSNETIPEYVGGRRRRRLDNEFDFLTTEVESSEQYERQLVKVPSCPGYCRTKPWYARCKVLKCGRSGGSTGTTRFLSAEQAAESSSTTQDDDVYNHRQLVTNETISFDFTAAKRAMYEALRAYATSLKIEIIPDLATDQDYTDVVAKWTFPMVSCEPHSINGELCVVRSYFGYPDAVYVSFWFIERFRDFDNTTGYINPDYFSTLTEENYFRTVLIVENGEICRAAIERIENNPSLCASCTICDLEAQTFTVDCTNLYADLGIGIFERLWKGDNRTCESAFPVFFPLKTFHSWMVE